MIKKLYNLENPNTNSYYLFRNDNKKIECFFEDKIIICKINSNQIFSTENIGYSDHQHKENVGEGHFHINN